MDDLYNESLVFAVDIVEHLPTLKALAEKYDEILELGVRNGYSTSALLAGKPKKLVSVDIISNQRVADIKLGNFEYVIADSREYDSSAGFDFMFIDTLHQYNMLKSELDHHHSNIRHCIAFHDTVSFGSVDEFTGEPLGLNKAINEFLAEHHEWSIEKIYENNNGLTILKHE